MSLTVIAIFIIIALLAGWLWIHTRFNYWQRRHISNVRGFFGGNLIDIITQKTNLGYRLKSVYLDGKFEKDAVVGIFVPHRPALLIRDPVLLKSIFCRDFHHFRNRSARSDPHRDPLGTVSLTISPYNYWKEMRPKVGSIFGGGKLMNMYPLIRAVCGNLERHLHAKSSGCVIDMKHLANLYTIDVINSTILGMESNVLENPHDPLASELQRLTHFDWKRYFHWFLIFLVPQLAGLFRAKLFLTESEDFLRMSTTSLIAHRERSGVKRNDLIDVCVKLKQEAGANGDNMSALMNSITSQVGTFMFAGHDSSSTTLSNALMELAKHPDMQQRLRKEIMQAFREGKGELSYDALSDLEYLGMVVDETLRMYPVTPLLEREHNPADDGTLYSLQPYFDYILPPGMAVFISVFGLHHDPKYWPNPDVFDPERFTVQNKRARHPMVYMPFGHGPRNCVGLRLGLLQVKLGLVHLLKNHYVQVCDQTNLNPEFDANALVTKVKGGIHLQIVRDSMFDMIMLK